MKSIAIIVERNDRIAGKTINDCWAPLTHPGFHSVAEAIHWTIEANLWQFRNRAALRVLDRVQTDTGEIVDHQVYPHWEPAVRTLSALRTKAKLETETNIQAQAALVAA